LRHEAQAAPSLDTVLRRRLAGVVIVSATLVLSACAGRGGIETLAADPTLVTGSAQQVAGATDETTMSDEKTIRDAVSSANIESLGANPLAWANAYTGSRGTVTALSEHKLDDGRVCRKFSTTRESFDGVGVYNGETCTASANNWFMRAFSRL
jgi:surface antigen